LLQFSKEAAIYAALVIGYLLLILKYLGDWLAGLYKDHRGWYAAVALLLVLSQGVLLERLTVGLIRLTKKRKR